MATDDAAAVSAAAALPLCCYCCCTSWSRGNDWRRGFAAAAYLEHTPLGPFLTNVGTVQYTRCPVLWGARAEAEVQCAVRMRHVRESVPPSLLIVYGYVIRCPCGSAFNVEPV